MAGDGFRTVYGRGLLPELRAFVHRPALLGTMDDLWPLFRDQLDGDHLADVYLVSTLDLAELEAELERLPACASVIGVGGGQAVDVAKFVAWRRRLPLFQAPTAMSVNAPFGHRAGLRVDGVVRYLGWAIPEAVYIDFDVVQRAPALLNRSGVGDVLCYHTAHFDWRLAHEHGRTEPQWPYDPSLVAQARQRLDSVLAALDDIREVNEAGIRTLVEAHRWGGTTFHDSGWNPRHIEGVDHFLFYNLERMTGSHFIHGQPVGLGTVAGSLLQDNEPARMLAAFHQAGVDIRPEAMGVTWDAVAEALRTLRAFVREAGLWYTIGDERDWTDDLIAELRDMVTGTFGPWGEAAT
jgi:glycerol-1-phosphate dehydrogenase [NAD(P)+]